MNFKLLGKKKTRRHKIREEVKESKQMNNTKSHRARELLFMKVIKVEKPLDK